MLPLLSDGREKVALMGERPLVSVALGRAILPRVHTVQGYVIGGRQHKQACRCRACGLIRIRAREKMASRVLFEYHC
jgi:hypothetical protein